MLTITQALCLAAALMGAPSDSTLDRAEALLAGGRLAEARRLLERITIRESRNTRALVLLGRVHLAWPTVGRYRAWQLFEDAARLAPNDPVPRYFQIQVGRYLGGDDGQRLARDAVVRLLDIDPDYRDGWAAWRETFRTDGHRRRTLQSLERHAGVSVADLRRAELLIELERVEEAERLLAGMITGGRDDAAPWALRAQAALEAGDAEHGLAWYDSALVRAASDTADYLWGQVRGIATPDEDRAFRVTTDPEGFFRSFWTERESDLTTAPNERIAEHFARLRVARRDYRLLHPFSYFHRSAGWRALTSGAATEVLGAIQGFGLPGGVIPGRSSLEDSVQAAGLGVDVRDLPEPDSITRYRSFGLDGRGLVYLRFGEPKQRLIGGAGAVGGSDVESWVYEVDGRAVNVTFARATSAFGFGGDVVVYPTSRHELHNSVILLERSATSLDAGLPLAAWIATFRSGLLGEQSVYVRSKPEPAAVALWDPRWREAARASGSGPIELTVPPGPYRIGVDARSDGRLGRFRGSINVPGYGPGLFELSSLLLGAVRDTAFDRDDVARGMPGDLVLPVNAPFALYAEIYDIPADGNGIASFDVEYTFDGPDGNRRATLAFFRRATSAETLVERVLVQPGQIPAGRYRVTLTIHDRVSGLQQRVTRTDVQLR